MKLAYLINQYPQPSQSFIRREIASLEALGLSIDRFTLRHWDGKLVDPADIAEAGRTMAILETGVIGLLIASIKCKLTHPILYFRAFMTAVRAGWKSDRGLLVHLIYLAEACALREQLAKRDISHLHAHFGTNSTTVAMLCRILGGPPYSFTAHGPEEFDRPEFLALARKIEYAKFVLAISEFGRSQLFRWCAHENWPKIHVIRCGVDAMFLNQPLTPVPSNKRLVCVGRLSEQKGQLILLEAAARIVAEHSDLEIVLVGHGPMCPQIELAIERLKLQRNVRITGFVTNQQVRDEILAGRAMVLPSFAEGLPVVLMEALALGRPVISTMVAGIPELVRPGESGWLVPPGSAEALANAIREALNAPVERLSEMGGTGAAIVKREHNASVQAGKLLALLTASVDQGFSFNPKSAIQNPKSPEPSPLPSP